MTARLKRRGRSTTIGLAVTAGVLAGLVLLAMFWLRPMHPATAGTGTAGLLTLTAPVSCSAAPTTPDPLAASTSGGSDVAAAATADNPPSSDSASGSDADAPGDGWSVLAGVPDATTATTASSPC